MIVQLELWTMWLKTKYIWDNPTRKSSYSYRDSCFLLSNVCYYTIYRYNLNQVIYNYHLNRFSKIVEIGLSTNLFASLI